MKLFLSLLLAGPPIFPPIFNRAVTLPTPVLAEHVDFQRAVVSSPDDGAVTLIPRTGTPRTVQVGSGKVRAVQVTPDGRTLGLQLDFDACRVVIWDFTTGKAVARLQGDFRKVLSCHQATEFQFSAKFTPDGRFLLTADETGLRRWDARSGKLLGAQPGRAASVFPNELTPEIVAVAVTTAGPQLQVWNSGLTRRVATLKNLPGTCLRNWEPGVALAGTTATFSCRGEVRQWDWKTGKVLRLARQAPADVFDETPRVYDRSVALAEDQRGVALWDTRTGQRLIQVKVPERVQVTDVAFAPGGFLIVARSDGKVQMYDAARQGRYLRTLDVFPEVSGQQHLTLKTSPMWGQMLVATLRACL